MPTTAAYLSAPLDDKHRTRRGRRAFTERERLDHTWRRNPRHRRHDCDAEGCRFVHARRRWRMEGETARYDQEREMLAAELRRRARYSARPDELHHCAEQLAHLTPTGAGCLRLAHPGPGGGKRKLPYYITDDAMPAVAQLLDIYRWAKRLLSAAWRAAYVARARRVKAMLAALVRDDTANERAAPYPTTGERDSESLSLSGTSGTPTAPDWLQGVIARRVAGGEEVR